MGCEHGYFRDRGNDYLEARETPPMQIPPDLHTKPLDPLLPIPNNVPDTQNRAYGYQVPPPPALSVQGSGNEQYSVQRSGNARWLAAQKVPASVWPTARQYLTDNGFRIAEERPQTGEIITAWQSPTELSTPLARSLSTNGRLKPGNEVRARMRIEPGVASGSSEIFVQTQTRSQGSTSDPAWSSSQDSSALDDALLNQVLAGLDRSAEGGSSVSLLATGAYDTPERVTYELDGSGVPMLVLDSDLNRAWSSVGRAIEGADIRVDDMDRSLGVYYVNLAEGAQKPEERKPGFFGRLFGKGETKEEEDARARRFQVRLTQVGNAVQVTLDKTINTAAPNDIAEGVLKKLQTSMQYALRNPGQRQSGQLDPGAQP
ncbi:outer membrane protein assembly factor BamC [Pseudomonas psychrotolerans]|nr:outer membrane protein assembly factor BamC [Pseudomonas psychrotolerans]